MKLYNRTWTRRQLEARIGRIEQIGGIRRLHWSEGKEAGTEAIQVRTGAGLTFYVHPSRGLDIGLAEFAGTPLSWQSPNGDVHPAYYEQAGTGWLRTAAGGLLMTCGLTQAGSPGIDNGEPLGLHGRIHHTPARQVSAAGCWNDDEYEMNISGIVEEAAIFGHFLRLTRQIRARLGENRISITDTVENAGFAPAPHMMLYHWNFGFPLLDEKVQLHFPAARTQPRDEGVPLDGYDRWAVPDPSAVERVYYHTAIEADEAGRAHVRIRQPLFPVAGGQIDVQVRLSWSTDTLPHWVQWRMPGAGTHVLGIEPANCFVEGRTAERARGTLVTLAPGEKRTYQLELDITTRIE
jgi:hypothetical protein